MYMCAAHEIKKEHGSDGKSYADSDGFGMSLATTAIFDTSRNEPRTKVRILLGTLAKACLEPLVGPGGMSIVPQQMRGMFPPSRPVKVLFQTSGYVEMLRDELKEMGIRNVDVAEQNIIQSCELFSSSQNMPKDGPNMLDNPELIGDPRAMANRLMEQVEGPYVSEERESLRGWVPPSEPASERSEFIPTNIYMWLENEFRTCSARRRHGGLKRITSKYSASDVREYVECRMLLTKMAMRGMVNACKLLLDDCGANVEGAQAPDAKGWWKDIQNNSGNYRDLTPLHQAARNGKLEVCRLLLDHGANINQIDKDTVRGSPLHHAVSMGEIDCVKLLCERGADHTHVGLGGEALDISEMMAQENVYKRRAQEKVQQILREYDPRCSFCRQPNPPKQCPCKKERYCDAECQRGRWKLHKKYHKTII
ncbi:hypothetical protein ACHAWC_007670 [Mediolabrus comicus]